MGKFKQIFKKYYPFFAILLFALITAVIMFHRTPFWDEAHQVDIARLSLIEIFKITRIIGHPALWYLIIKPFSSPDIYPYGIYIVNWIFCIISLLILWKKAPFNLFIKTFITFSVPFLFFFGPVSRCYSIGLIFLFLLCAYYTEKEKHPYIYSSLIVVGANTSAMAMIGCFYLGLIFLYDLYKRKSKDLKNVLLIFFLCALFILAQYVGTDEPYDLRSKSFLIRMFYFIIFPMGLTVYSFLLHLFSSVMFYIFPFYSFKKSKRALFFISTVFLTLTYIFLFRYNGSYWNHYFYYIYFIMTFWIFYRELYSNKFIKILFCAILFMFCFRSAIFDSFVDIAYDSHSREISQIISGYKNHKIYTLCAWSDASPGADIFLLKENIDLYDRDNRKRTSYESLKNIYKMIDEKIDFDKLVKNMPENALIITGGDVRGYKFLPDTIIVKKDDDYIVQTENNVYHLKKLVHREDIKFFMYKPININSYGRIKIWN